MVDMGLVCSGSHDLIEVWTRYKEPNVLGFKEPTFAWIEMKTKQ